MNLRHAGTVQGPFFKNPERRLEFGNFFKTTEQLESDLASTLSPLICIESTSPALTVVKLVQALKKHDESFVALNARTLLASAEEMKSTFTSESRFTVVVECSPLNEDETVEARNAIDELVKASAKSEKRANRIILVTEERDDRLWPLDCGQHEMHLMRDESHCEDITSTAFDRLLQRTVIFQGAAIKLGELVGEDGGELLDGRVLGQIVDGEQVRVGKPLPDHGGTSGYYIHLEPKMHPNQLTMKYSEKSTEEIEAIIDSYTWTKVRVLEGEHGAGKSTALTKIALKRKAQKPEVFVIRLDTMDLVRHLRHLDNLDRDGLCDVFAATEKLDTAFARALLRHRLLKTGRVELFLDESDEVGPSDQQLVKTFKSLLGYVTKVTKIWMTVRPGGLQRKRYMYAIKYSMPAFDSGDQQRFLQSFWKQSLDTEEHGSAKYIGTFTDQLLEQLRVAGGVRHFDDLHLGAPLRLKIIARTFQVQCQAFCEVKGRIGPQPSDLLRRFVDDPFETYIEETAKLHRQGPHRKAVRRLAFRWLFPSHSKEKHVDTEPTDWPDVGSQPYFDHRVFAEFFAAEFVAEELAGGGSPELTDFLYRNYFLEVNFCFSRFLDLALARASDIHWATVNNDAKRVKELVDEDRSRLLWRDPMGRVPLHLASLFSTAEAPEAFDYLVREDVQEARGPLQIMEEDIWGFCPYAYAWARGRTTWAHLRLGWSYFDLHLVGRLDVNLFGAQVERLKFLRGMLAGKEAYSDHLWACNASQPSAWQYSWPGQAAPMSEFWTAEELLEAASTYVDDGGAEKARSFGALRPRFYRLCQAEQMELLRENDHELLKPALRSHFWDVACLRLSNRRFLLGVDKDCARRCHDWFWEALAGQDYPFLLGITLALPIAAKRLWERADPQRVFLGLVPESRTERSTDLKLRNFLALLLRQLLGCHGDHPLSALRCVDHFRRLAMEDNVSFKISLGMVHHEDQYPLLQEVECGCRDDILHAASDKNQVQLYNAFLFMKDHIHGKWTGIAAAINANSHGAINYFGACLERRDIAGFNYLLVYALSILEKRGLDTAVKRALRRMSARFQGDVYVPKAATLTDDACSQLRRSLGQYPSAAARGYPYSLTQHVASQIVWLDADDVPSMFHTCFEDRNATLDFPSEVVKALERTEMDDVSKFLDFCSDEEVRTLLRHNDFEIVKLCLRSDSSVDSVGRSQWLTKTIEQLEPPMSEVLKHEIANLDELKHGLLLSLEVINFRSFEVLESLLLPQAKKRFWEEAGYRRLYRDALRQADHELVIAVGKALNAASMDTSELELDKVRYFSKAFDQSVVLFNRLMRELRCRRDYFSKPRYVEGFRRAVVDMDFEGLDGLTEASTEIYYALESMVENVETKDYVRYLQGACRMRSIKGLHAFMECISALEAESVKNLKLICRGVHAPWELQGHQWRRLAEYIDHFLPALDRGLPGSLFQYVHYCVVCVTQPVKMPASVAAYLGGAEAVGPYLEEILKLKRSGEFKELCAWFCTASTEQKKLILGANDGEILKDAFRSDYFEELLIWTKPRHGYKEIRWVSVDEVLRLDAYVESVSDAIRKSQFDRLKRLTDFLHLTKKLELMAKVDFRPALANALAAKEHDWVRDFARDLRSEKQQDMFRSKDFVLYLNEVCLDNVAVFKAVVDHLSMALLDNVLTEIDYVGAFRNAAARADCNGLVQLYEMYGKRSECLDKVRLGVQSEHFIAYCRYCVLNRRTRFVVPCLSIAEKRRFDALVRLRCTFLTEMDFETAEARRSRRDDMQFYSCFEDEYLSDVKLEDEPEKIELGRRGEKRLIELMESYPSAVARGYPWSVFHFVSCAGFCFAESKPLPACISIYFEPRNMETPVAYVDEMMKAKDAQDAEEKQLWFQMATEVQRQEISKISPDFGMQ